MILEFFCSYYNMEFYQECEKYLKVHQDLWKPQEWRVTFMNNVWISSYCPFWAETWHFFGIPHPASLPTISATEPYCFLVLLLKFYLKGKGRQGRRGGSFHLLVHSLKAPNSDRLKPKPGNSIWTSPIGSRDRDTLTTIGYFSGHALVASWSRNRVGTLNQALQNEMWVFTAAFPMQCQNPTSVFISVSLLFVFHPHCQDFNISPVFWVTGARHCFFF